jgi:DNA-binding NarL/FixJ family response regulator
MQMKQEKQRDPRGRPLTRREQEVMALMVQGLSKAQAAESLGLRNNTIAVHVKHIYRKLGVHNRVNAVLAVLSGNSGGNGQIAVGLPSSLSAHDLRTHY